MKRLILTTSTAIAMTFTGCVTGNSQRDCIVGPAFDTLIAHRGESFDAPENTLPAYRMAVERGFGFECDIYRSADGRLFTFHDSKLTRTSGGRFTNACVNASWEREVSKLDVGGWGKWKDSKYVGTRPALFEEVLALARPGRKIYVEVKGGDAAVDWVQQIKKVVDKESKATPDTILFICFSAKTCKALKTAMPDFKVYWLTGEKLRPEEIITVLHETHADGVDIRYRGELHTAEFIEKIKASGYEFHIWTIDDPETAKEAFQRGVQTVTTNRAKFILEMLNK